jgi:Uma2 family endonuclease
MAVMTPAVSPAPSKGDQPLLMSYEEFLAWAGEDVHAEWVNGEVIVQMPPKEIHQNLIGFLHVLLRLFVQLFNLGKVYNAPFEMRGCLMAHRANRTCYLCPASIWIA